jgi:hypothetical protein
MRERRLGDAPAGRRHRNSGPRGQGCRSRRFPQSRAGARRKQRLSAASAAWRRVGPGPRGQSMAGPQSRHLVRRRGCLLRFGATEAWTRRSPQSRPQTLHLLRRRHCPRRSRARGERTRRSLRFWPENSRLAASVRRDRPCVADPAAWGQTFDGPFGLDVSGPQSPNKARQEHRPCRYGAPSLWTRRSSDRWPRSHSAPCCPLARW